MRSDLLFCNHDSFAVIQHQKHAVTTEISAIDSNRLLNSNADDLVSYFVEKYRIVAPQLHDDQMSVDQHEAKRDVSGDPLRAGYFFESRGPLIVTGTQVIVEIPFSGDPGLFSVRPSTFNSNPPRGTLKDGTLQFHYWSDQPNQEQLRTELDQWLNSVKQYLGWIDNSFAEFNRELETLARTAITQRRDKLLAAQNLVAGLGIPLKKRADAPATYRAPEVQRKLSPKLPPVTKGTFKPEPALDEAEYQHILGILEGMVKVMERSPKAFHGIDEEALRTHFLVQLNGQYEGQATGETFNYEGKTDILIRSGDRNIFIAECKFWSGPQKLLDTIDQLLGYLSWRDSKAAILIFNRNKEFSKVLAAIPETAKKHPNFQKDEGARSASSFRFAFRHKDDPAKVLHLTIMAFDVPAALTEP